MRNLSNNALLTDKEKARLIWAYDCLQIPTPNYNEYYNGNTNVTFINQAALTLRLQRTDRVSLVRHPHVVRPIGSIALSNKWRLDIVQGGETSVSQIEAYRVHQSISSMGFIADDIGERHGEERNCLRISKKTDSFPRGFPVGYDFWYLSPSKVSVQLGKKPFDLLIRSKPYAWIHDTRPQKGQKPDIQDEEYGDLRDAFMNAWKKANDGKTEVIHDKINTFWQACIDARKNGRIIAGWLEATSKLDERTRLKSINYERRLRQESPAFT